MALMGLDWVTGVVLLLGGALLGGFLVRIFGAESGREKQLQQELEKTRKEFSDYKGEVADHFRDTAEAVNAMTESYRQVYDKLRVGASRLCGEGGQLLDLKPAPLLEEGDPESTTETPETGSREGDPGLEQVDENAAGTAGEATTVTDPEERQPAESEEAPEVSADTESEQPAPEEPRAPLDYAAESEEEDRDKTLH